MSGLWNNPAYLRSALLALAAALFVIAFLVRRARAAAPAAGRSSYLAAEVLEPRSFLLWGAARAAFLVLALALAGCLILILLPESTVEKMVRLIRATRAAERPAPPIALLYLGDELKGKEFHVRGFIRNISPRPLEKLDASIRLYRADGTLLETYLTRMDLESIPPDATAEFHLVYPDFEGQFRSYSADFKLRDGEFLAYKDWRSTRRLN